MGVSTCALVRVFSVIVLLALVLDLVTICLYKTKHEVSPMLFGLTLGISALMILGIVVKLLMDFGIYLKEDGCCHSKKVYTNIQ